MQAALFRRTFLQFVTFLSLPLLSLKRYQCHAIETLTNFCERYDQVEKNEIPLHEALKGMNITAAVFAEINPANPYIAPKLLNLIARRAQFHVIYNVTLPRMHNETWTDVLMRDMSKFDLACDWWHRTIYRLDLGIVFPEGWYEADTIMMRKKNTEANSSQFWAFSMPFSPDLWLLTVFIIMMTGVVYFFLDYLESKAMKENTDTSFLGSIFFSFHSFTGHCNYTAKSISSQILTTSMCFLYLILISGYTANLANFFILKNAPILNIDNLQDVVDNSLSLCVVRGLPNTEHVQKNFPDANLVIGDSIENSFVSLSNGECDIGLVSVEEWKTMHVDSRYNRGCDLEWIGRRIDTTSAGFALSDSREHCSSLLDSVINLHMVQLKTEGILDDVWSSYREVSTSSNCQSTIKSNSKRNVQLNVENMSGAFAFHMCFVAASVLLALYEFFHQPKEVAKLIKSDFMSTLSFFEDAVRSTTASFFEGGAAAQHDVKVEDPTHEELTEKSLAIAKGMCANLQEDDVNNLSLQNKLILSQKIEHVTNVLQRNRAFAARKVHKIMKVVDHHCKIKDEELQALKHKIKILEEAAASK